MFIWQLLKLSFRLFFPELYSLFTPKLSVSGYLFHQFFFYHIDSILQLLIKCHFNLSLDLWPESIFDLVQHMIIIQYLLNSFFNKLILLLFTQSSFSIPISNFVGLYGIDHLSQRRFYFIIFGLDFLFDF